MARNWRPGLKWMKGVVVAVLGPTQYRIQVGQELWRRHADHLFAYKGSSAGDPEVNVEQEPGEEVEVMAPELEFELPEQVGGGRIATEPELPEGVTESAPPETADPTSPEPPTPVVTEPNIVEPAELSPNPPSETPPEGSADPEQSGRYPQRQRRQFVPFDPSRK